MKISIGLFGSRKFGFISKTNKQISTSIINNNSREASPLPARPSLQNKEYSVVLTNSISKDSKQDIANDISSTSYFNPLISEFNTTDNTSDETNQEQLSNNNVNNIFQSIQFLLMIKLSSVDVYSLHSDTTSYNSPKDKNFESILPKSNLFQIINLLSTIKLQIL